MKLLAVVSRTAVSTTADGRTPYDRGAVVRVRTVLVNPDSGTLFVDEHVRVRAPARNRWQVLGDVLVEPGEGAWQADRLAVSCPGALVVAVHHGPRCWLRLGPDGRMLVLEAGGPGQPPEGFWETVASLAHSWLVSGLSASALGSVAGCHLRAHISSGPPCSNRRSRHRAASASSDPDRPTEE
ncbi:transcriptional regulator [Streptomyces sp. NPDC017991]|uniref:transcriptional regulator n=1 Tax=Streptomyces sp. NPDC017991 TaxID=3365026 RepID=UPI00379BA809